MTVTDEEKSQQIAWVVTELSKAKRLLAHLEVRRKQLPLDGLGAILQILQQFPNSVIVCDSFDSHGGQSPLQIDGVVRLGGRLKLPAEPFFSAAAYAGTLAPLR
jgi:hypothetical protein